MELGPVSVEKKHLKRFLIGASLLSLVVVVIAASVYSPQVSFAILAIGTLAVFVVASYGLGLIIEVETDGVDRKM